MTLPFRVVAIVVICCSVIVTALALCACTSMAHSPRPITPVTVESLSDLSLVSMNTDSFRVDVVSICTNLPTC